MGIFFTLLVGLVSSLTIYSTWHILPTSVYHQPPFHIVSQVDPEAAIEGVP